MLTVNCFFFVGANLSVGHGHQRLAMRSLADQERKLSPPQADELRDIVGAFNRDQSTNEDKESI
jgi:hypothetical protein